MITCCEVLGSGVVLEGLGVGGTGETVGGAEENF